MRDNQRAGIDGMVPAFKLPRDPCCPPSLCNLDPCGFVCNFISALPRGPLWDRAKAEALSRYAAANDPADCGTSTCEEHCATMVDHAIYTARRVLDALFGALAPAIQEASPFSAYATLDEWLERLGWKDCYDCACRELGRTQTPYETWGVIDLEGLCEGPICAKPEFPAELQTAVKRGIVIALSRLAIGPRRNLDAINFVIEPLAARLEPLAINELTLDPARCSTDDGTTLCDVTPTMNQFEFCIRPTGDYLPKARPVSCDDPDYRRRATGPWNTVLGSQYPDDLVQAYYETTAADAEGLPPRIYPAVMAAECVVRAMLPPGKSIKLTLCI